MKPEHTRLFNIAHARAGAPFCGSNGEVVRVLIWDRKHPTHPIVLIEEDGDQEAVAFRVDGTTEFGAGYTVRELVMLPLGLVQGDPFFVGDTIVGATGATFIAEPRDKDGTHDAWKWPAPPRVYPCTRMENADFAKVLRCGSSFNLTGCRNIADAAIWHAVNAGQVVTKEDHESALVKLGECLRDIEITRNSLRDMAIAEAVRVACQKASCAESAGTDGGVAISQFNARARMSAINIAEIIATVKER